MPSFLVISGLRTGLTEQELNDILEQGGPSDRTSVQLLQEADACVAIIGVPWETAVAVDVARKMNGTTLHGQKLNVHATAVS